MRNGITLTPNGPFSPGPNTMMRFVNENSVDHLNFACDFQISEESRKELEGGAEPRHDPNPPPLSPAKSSLAFGEIEAVSALGHLADQLNNARAGLPSTTHVFSGVTATAMCRNWSLPIDTVIA